MIHHAEIFPAARMDFNSIYVKQNDKHPSKSKSKFMSKYSTVMLRPKETETPTIAQNVVKVFFSDETLLRLRCSLWRYDVVVNCFLHLQTTSQQGAPIAGESLGNLRNHCLKETF